jgi:hypothetical protein
MCSSSPKQCGLSRYVELRQYTPALRPREATSIDPETRLATGRPTTLERESCS